MSEAVAAVGESGAAVAPGATLSIDEVGARAATIVQNVETVIAGKREAVTAALTVLLAEGHLLIEDVPGVGKTMLAKALARSVDATVSRIQFTPDLLPSDVTGVSVFDQVGRRFEFKRGPVFANIVIGDEINRASPKTQSALLECMEERQVTADGTTYRLDPPFTVVATQNPVEMEGTYPLPEAQRDRFMARISMGYPSPADELAMLATRETSSPIDDLGAGRRARRAACHDPARCSTCSPRSPSRSTRSSSRAPPATTASCASVRARARRSSSSARPRRTRRCTAATSCFPTTSTRSPCPCSRTASCPRAARSAATTATAVRSSTPSCDAS